MVLYQHYISQLVVYIQCCGLYTMHMYITKPQGGPWVCVLFVHSILYVTLVIEISKLAHFVICYSHLAVGNIPNFPFPCLYLIVQFIMHLYSGPVPCTVCPSISLVIAIARKLELVCLFILVASVRAHEL